MQPDVPSRVLIGDDQADVLEALRLLLKPEGYVIDTASSPAQVMRALDLKDYDVVLIDLNYSRDTTSGEEGLDLLKRIRLADESLPVVVMTAWGSVDVAVEAMRRGARDFVQKPWDNERLLAIVRTQTELGRAIRLGRRLELANQALMADGRSPLHRRVAGDAAGPRRDRAGRPLGRQRAGHAARTAPARAWSRRPCTRCRSRAPRPMVTVNAGGMAEGVFESELFGHVRGAFTDAKADRVGRFELADGSTLFLDEIANVPSSQQAKLLRVIETGEFERVGSSRTRKVDVRVVSATNADLNAEVEAGRFRQDLLFRLNTIEIVLPPLRDRREDIPLLARHFLAQHTQRYRKGVTGFEPAALQLLIDHRWPGNVRELDHAIERGGADGAGRGHPRRRSRPARRGGLGRAPRGHEPRRRRGLPHQQVHGPLRQRQPRRPRPRPVTQRALPPPRTLQAVSWRSPVRGLPSYESPSLRSARRRARAHGRRAPAGGHAPAAVAGRLLRQGPLDGGAPPRGDLGRRR